MFSVTSSYPQDMSKVHVVCEALLLWLLCHHSPPPLALCSPLSSSFSKMATISTPSHQASSGPVSSARNKPSAIFLNATLALPCP